MLKQRATELKKIHRNALKPQALRNYKPEAGKETAQEKKKKKAKNISIWRQQIVTGYVTDSY